MSESESPAEPPSAAPTQLSKFLATLARLRRESEERTFGPGSAKNPIVLEDDEEMDVMIVGEATARRLSDCSSEPAPNTRPSSPAYPAPTGLVSPSDGGETPLGPLQATEDVTMTDADAGIGPAEDPETAPDTTGQVEAGTSTGNGIVRMMMQEIKLSTSAAFPEKGSFWRTTSTAPGPLSSPPEINADILKTGHVHWHIHGSRHQYWVWTAKGAWQEAEIGTEHPTTTKRRLQHLNPNETGGKGPVWVLTTSYMSELYRRKAISAKLTLDYGEEASEDAGTLPTTQAKGDSDPLANDDPAGLNAATTSTPSRLLRVLQEQISLKTSIDFPKQETFTRTTSCSSDPLRRPPEMPELSLQPGDMHWHIQSEEHQYWVRQRNNTWVQSQLGTPHPLTSKRCLQHSRRDGKKGKGPTWVLTRSYELLESRKGRERREVADYDRTE